MLDHFTHKNLSLNLINLKSIDNHKAHQIKVISSKTPGTWKQGVDVLVGCQAKYLVPLVDL